MNVDLTKVSLGIRVWLARWIHRIGVYSTLCQSFIMRVTKEFVMEEWKPVVGYENSYLISDSGEVWSRLTYKTRASHANCSGHLKIKLCKNGIIKEYGVHRLVYEAFNGPIGAGLLVLHRDGKPSNNSPENLYAGTHADNIQDALRHGVYYGSKGTENGGAKLAEREVLKIRALHKTCKYTYVSLSKLFRITPEAISLIVRRKTWKHI